MRSLLIAMVVAIGAGACGRTVTLADEVDLTWDFAITPFDRYVDKLHAPYVRGTSLWLWATSDDNDDDVTNWQIVSSDPSVLRIDESMRSPGSLGVKVTAVGEGSVDLAVIDEHGTRLGHGVAEVAVPDRVELDAHGYLIVGLDERAPVSEARIAAADSATYLVRYFQGDRELYGNGVLTVQAPSTIEAEPRTTYLFEKREWLTLTPNAVGTTTAQLYVDKTHISDVDVIGVAPTDITDVALIGQSEQGRHDGDWLVVLAQASDAAGRNVFGVDYHWNVNGASQIAMGDLYRYEYKQGVPAMVEVERMGHTDTVDIQSDRGFVDNSNHLGCGVSRGGGSLVLVVASLVLVTRRRRAGRAQGVARNGSTVAPRIGDATMS